MEVKERKGNDGRGEKKRGWERNRREEEIDGKGREDIGKRRKIDLKNGRV